MKFTDVKTLEHLLKEYKIKEQYPIPSGEQGHGTKAKQNKTSTANKLSFSPTTTNAPKPKEPEAEMPELIKAKDVQPNATNKTNFVSYNNNNEPLEVVSPVNDGDNPEALVVRDKKGNYTAIAGDEEVQEIPEGKLAKIAKRKGKKLKIKSLKGKIKRLSKSRLKEADPKLFEINFNRKNVATEALDAPVKCGFEAETFFYSVDSRGASDDVDNMSISDIEYEYGDMPDQVWEDFEEWLYTKGQDEYLDDIIEDKVNEVREDEEYLNNFIDSGSGPSSEAIERYKEEFEENDPKEYENREEDGWEYMNWVREYVEEEYEEAYLEWLDIEVREEYNFEDDAKEAARDDYSTEDWIYDNYSYMSSFLDDYGYDYSSGGGSVEGVADELHTWIRDNSSFTEYPESGDYGDTNTTTAWAVENDSSIEPDEGAGAELISPVFDSPRKMLTEMKSLFDWSEKNFGTNNSTGLHVTMSWHGKNPDTVKDEDDEFYGNDATGPNKLKMALLLGDEYLLAEFGRLRNSYTKSQYNNVLKYAEGMKRGDAKSFKEFEKMLTKGIDTGKFNSIHFKGEKDRIAGTNLVEFRIAGGTDYNTMYEKVVKAVVRYSTIMKAGYEDDAFRKDYVNAVFRLLRKSQEIDPKKLKDLEVVNHEVIDAAKGIVGKKDYFDVIKLLGSSVEYLQNYEKLSSPDADKEWKQEIKDYEKGTGSKVEIEEETVQGYVKPNSMAPSKRAAGELKKSQERFGSAITILARDIADGNNRAPVSAKNIGAFRKFAKELKLNTDAVEKLAFIGMKEFISSGTDKENVANLQKGINALFKQDIVKKPEYLAIKDVDIIGNKIWQFYQSEDAKDNIKMDQLAELLVNLNPSNDKIDVDDVLRELSHERSLNGFIAKLKGSGWNTRVSLLKNNGITSKGSAQELLKFLEPYSDYKHPTSPDHHVNIKSDDKYEDVFQMALVQRLRDRLAHLKDLETEDKEKYMTIAKQVSKLGIELLNGLKPRPDMWSEENGYKRGNDGPRYLASHDSLERWNDAADRLVKIDDEIGKDDGTYNFDRAFDDYVLSSLNVGRYFNWKQSDGPIQDAEIKELVKERFAAIKKFLSAFDKIFQKEGFTNLKKEIQAKNTLDRRNRDFEKNVRDNAKAKLNIPSHSWMYIDKDFYDTITDKDYDDRAAYLDNHIEHFNKQVNQSRVYVIPSSHWSDAEDATNGLELIDTFEKNKNYFHTWRKKGYKRIVNRFNNKYGFSWKHLNDKDKFVQGDGDLYSTLKKLGIEVTHNGDSRKGAPGQDDLFTDEETRNPKSGEPLNRSSATSWSINNDEASQKQFDAFDWEQYPAKMKDIVAKVMNKDRYGSFKVALEDVLRKVLDGDVDIDKDNLGKPLDKLATAAGIDPDDGGSSNGIASQTDWGNLADHLSIERGVNDQGVELLRKVYAQYDGNHNWRPGTDPEGQDVIGLARWAAAVREAEKYIRDNYNVSGGNYFRKNVDGSDGDDVSAIYSTPAYTPDADYDRARNDYYMFNDMMSAGMQNYLNRGEVNNLVAFLNNTDNSNNFKQNVLRTLISRANNENGPFATFQDALAVTRRTTSGNESVFAKFDKLPLQEQLRYLERIDNNKFKTIPNTIKVEGAVPDNTKVRIINKLLSDHMPASDLKKQMDAYFAIPNPQMINDFRSMKVQGGDDACLRGVLRNYVKTSMHPSLVKRVNLNEVYTGSVSDSKKDVIDKISALPDDGEQTSKIISYIEQLLNDMGVGGRLASIMQGLEDVDDTTVNATIKKIAKIIASIEMTPLERAQLFAMWQKDTLVDISNITTPGTYTFKDIFKGYSIDEHMTELVDDLADVSGYGIGAGEFLFAVLSKRISGIGSGKGVGDLIVDGKNVEVKTKTAKNARFVDYHVKPDDNWQSKTKEFYKEFADIDIVANSPATGINTGDLMNCLRDPKLIQEPLRAQNFLKHIKGLFNSHMPTLDGSQLTQLVNLFNSGNEAEFKKIYGALNILNYMNVKNAKGDLDGIMFVDKPTKTLCYVKTIDDILARDLAVGTIYTVTKEKSYPYPQIGLTK